MAELTIKTNHHWRESIRWEDLTEKERSDFDYLDTPDARLQAEFTRYRGFVIHINEMQRITRNGTPYGDWDGVCADSFFSGVLIKFDRHCERFQLGTYYC